MKANELMIGDWVKVVSCPLPLKVRSVEDGKIGLCHSVLWNNSIGWTRIDVPSSTYEEDVEPIPLTKEILEKNGFKIVYGFGYSDKYPTLGWGYHNGIHDYCSIDVTFYDTPINGVSHLVKINRNSASGDGINTVHNCDIDYVHQLQHAIRLCGIEKDIIEL